MGELDNMFSKAILAMSGDSKPLSVDVYNSKSGLDVNSTDIEVLDYIVS